jgi:hypothetical protein
MHKLNLIIPIAVAIVGILALGTINAHAHSNGTCHMHQGKVHCH